MNIEEVRETVEKETARVAVLGNWPSWMQHNTLSERIPKEGKEGPGFDAGIACTLNLIPPNRQKLSAILHAAYTPEAIEQIREEGTQMDANSETCWWLFACSLCEEGGIGINEFLDQIEAFESVRDGGDRQKEANGMLAEMRATYSLDKYGFPFGTVDGCIQGAYLDGHDWATNWSENYGLFFIGTPHPSLGLENFKWSDELDEGNRAKSGPVFGSWQFVKCANEDEFLRAVEVVKAHFG